MPPILTDHVLVDRILAPHRAALGADFDGYRHHIYRVVNFFNGLGPIDFNGSPALPIAAAFHDLGIWVDGTFDYLEPSSQLALRFIEAEGLDDVDPELVHELIVQHHKLRPFRAGPWAAMVDQWRRADTIDVSLGIVTFGIPRARIREIQRRLPDRGFHVGLLRRTAAEFLRKPWNPLPMMRW